MSTEVAEQIRARLGEVFGPSRLVVRDDSALHAGHAGAREGGHYHVQLLAEAFRGLSPLARHRLVYEALAPLMAGRIHALSIDAGLPDNPKP